MSWKKIMKERGDSDVSNRNRLSEPYRLRNAKKSTVEHHAERCLAHNPKSVLDLGCGDGPWLDAAGEAARFINYTGIDYSSTQINLAKSFYAGPNINLIIDDIEECDFGGKPFDAVASHLVLHLLDDPNKVIRKAYASMRSGAAFHIAVPAYWLKNSTEEYSRLTRISSVFNRFEEGAVPPASTSMKSFRSEEGIRQVLDECGFLPENIEFEYDPLDLSGMPSEVVSFMINLYSFQVLLDSVKPSAAAAFMEAALAEKDSNGNVICHRPDGVYHRYQRMMPTNRH